MSCSYGYKLLCVDKFSGPLKSYLGENGVYNFINNVVKESKHFSNVIKEHFHKEFVMAAKKDDKDFDNST